MMNKKPILDMTIYFCFIKMTCISLAGFPYISVVFIKMI